MTLFGTIYYKIATKTTDFAGLQSLVAVVFMVRKPAHMVSSTGPDHAPVPCLFAERPFLLYNDYDARAAQLFQGACSLLPRARLVHVRWHQGVQMRGLNITVPLPFVLSGMAPRSTRLHFLSWSCHGSRLMYYAAKP